MVARKWYSRVVPMHPSMRLTPKSCESWRKGSIATGRFLTVQPRTCPAALQFIWRLALEALQLRDIQRRVLRNNQLVAAHLDAVQRSRCPLEIIAAIKHLGQHDLGVGVARPKGFGLFQPFLRL